MKKLLPCFLLLSPTLFSQEFTKPDSLAIVKNHVQAVKIFFTGEDGERSLAEEFHYDKKGLVVFEQEDSADYHYEYFYNGKNQLIRSEKWHNEYRELIVRDEYTYYDSGKKKTDKSFDGSDTAFPFYTYEYDEVANKTTESGYDRHRLYQVQIKRFNEAGNCIYEYDSTGTGSSESVKGKPVRWTYHSHTRDSTWLFTYDDQQRLTEARMKKSGAPDVVYTIRYANSGHELRLNGVVCSAPEVSEFEKKFRGPLGIPQPVNKYEENDDTIVETVYRHKLEYDKKKNLVKDQILYEDHPSFGPGFFTYEYTFY